MRSFFLFYLLAFVPNVSNAANATMLSQELDALENFYFSLNGPDWRYYGDEVPWNFSSDSNPCIDGWAGITCVLPPPYGVYYVEGIELFDSGLAGSLPLTLNALTHMVALDLSYNFITGNIPVLNGLLKMQELSLAYNMLSGSLPSFISGLTNLAMLDVSYNKLEGSIEQAFNATVQSDFSYVDISSNAFTGTLPEKVFMNPNLSTAIFDHNCFHGTLTSTICYGHALEYVYMDCLACGSRCTYRPVSGDSYIVRHPVHGTIPACVFDLPNLRNLDLSMNWFSGSIPSNVSRPTDYPLYLYLDYNALTGSFPEWIEQMLSTPGTLISVTHNRMHGAITNEFTEGSSYAFVTYNRMSGHPFGASWVNTSYIEILEGNIFSCTRDKSDINEYDLSRGNYQCGSSNIDQPIYAWLGIVGTILMIVAVVLRWTKFVEQYLGVSSFLQHVVTWNSITDAQSQPDMINLSQVFSLSGALRKCGLACTVFAVCVLIPAYAILTTSYGTYHHQFAWVVSSVLLSGRVPFALCFVCFASVVGCALWSLWRGSYATSDDGNVKPAAHRWFRMVATVTIYLVINVFVVGLVNVSYVAAARYASTKYQLGISAFKVAWNLMVVPFLSRGLAYELQAARADWITLELFVSLLCNVGIPLLAVVIVSEQCFFPLYATLANDVAFSLGLVSAPNVGLYDQPFYYSYQCSYLYMNYYAAAYVYMCLMANFGTPVIELTAQQLHRRARPGTYWFLLLDAALPRILKPVEADPTLVPARNMMKPYFDSTQFVVAQFTYLAMILTLGLVFPPLAVMLAVCMVTTSLYATMKIGRLLANAREAGNGKYAELIEQECAGVSTSITRALWLVLWYCAMFYPLFLFDTLGDAVGFQRAYWVLIAVPLLPVVMLPFAVIDRRHQSDASLRKETTNVSDIELAAAVSPLSSDAAGTVVAVSHVID